MSAPAFIGTSTKMARTNVEWVVGGRVHFRKTSLKVATERCRRF
jgi:hypothetical protein